MGETLLVLLRVAVSLGVVIALIVYVGRRMQAGRAVERSREADVHVVGRQGLGRHSGVAVIAAGDRRLLVGFSDSSVQLLTELGPVAAVPDQPAGERAASPRSRKAAGALSAFASSAVGSSTGAAPSGAVPAVGSTAASATSPAGSTDAASTLAGATTAVVPRPRPALDDSGRQSVLAGSVLSPQTWRAAVRALQDRTVRR